MEAFEWSASPLGPPSGWPQSLQTALRITLTSRFPMVIWWGPELRLLYNDAWRPALGALKHPRALGSPGREIWPEIWHVIGPMLEGVLATGVATWEDDQLLVFDRYGYLEETYWTYSYSPIWLESGVVGGVFTAVTETTDRVIGERRLRTLRDLSERTSEARSTETACALAAEVLSHNSHDFPFALVYLWEADGVARRVGASGIDPAHPLAPERVRPDDPGAPWRFARGGGRTELRSEVPLPGGPWEIGATEALVIPLASSGREEAAGFLVAGVSPRLVLNDEYRAFLQLVAGHIATAVSNARAYEEERRRAEALAELDRAKTAFFSNVSHELRTPLTLQLGPIEDALEDGAVPLPDVHRERLAVAHRNSLRLLKLVNTLLDFSRLEAGRVDASFEATDLAELTADVASTFRSAIERAGLRYEVECQTLPEPVYVDRQMWEKIVLNLLSNAFKFTLEGGIRIRLRPAGPKAELTVTDTGCGIPASELHRVFERFHRIRASRSRTQEGTGIGLALVRELARLHGGDVEVESAEDAGSTFRVTIPFGTAHLPAEQIGADRRLVSTALGAAPYVEEALRWSGGQAGPALENGTEALAATEIGGRAAPAADQAERVLLADDNADMREYVARLLSAQWRVETVGDGRTALERARASRPDLIITDVMMPGLDGFELVAALRGDPETAGIPIIMLSARAGEEARVEGLEAGADDYLVKPFGARELLARVGGALALARVRREAHAAIRDSEERLRLALHAARMASWEWRPQTDEIFLSSEMGPLFGGAPGWSVSGFEAAMELIHPDDRERVRATIEKALRGETPYEFEFASVGPDGSPRQLAVLGQVYRDPDGSPRRVVGVTWDRTEARRAEDRLRQVQRIEAVGRLGGGVAHEVNNQMGVVLGFADFVLRRPELSESVRADVEVIRQAAERAAGITAQLLAFSRRQLLRPQVLDLDLVVREFAPVLRRVLPEGCTLEFGPTRGTGRVMADRGQLEQVLLNLALNAGDAMPRGGRLAVEIEDVELDPRYAQARAGARVRPGHYVRLAVSDTGHGMDPKTLSHALEPFYTTKGVGKGTGLGLSSVYGIVKQSGGYVWLYSEPGLGTTVKIYLPRTEAVPQVPGGPEAGARPTATGTVLVAEDDAMMRAMTVRSLREEGYEVLEAGDGKEALELARQHPGPLALLVTDVVMPGLNGRELAVQLSALRPGLPVLSMSGYTDDEIVRRGLLDEGHPFLQKPFSTETLLRQVRALIEGGGA